MDRQSKILIVGLIDSVIDLRVKNTKHLWETSVIQLRPWPTLYKLYSRQSVCSMKGCISEFIKCILENFIVDKILTSL